MVFMHIKRGAFRWKFQKETYFIDIFHIKQSQLHYHARPEFIRAAKTRANSLYSVHVAGIFAGTSLGDTQAGVSFAGHVEQASSATRVYFQVDGKPESQRGV
jgi:hypothetical protein